MAEQISSLQNNWFAEDTSVSDTLREAAIVRSRLLSDSSNYVFLVDLEHPKHGAGLGVYKPQRGERPLADFPHGTLYHREIAAYEYAQLLGWNNIPPTIACSGPEGPGSIQLFIEHDPSEHFFTLRDRNEFQEQFIRFAVFDILTNNADRKSGHLILDTHGQVWGIDNALCFNSEEKLRTVIWDFAGKRLPEHWLLDIQRVRDCLLNQEESAATFLACLFEEETAALIARSNYLLEHPVLPEMYPWRCVPWPLV